MLKELLTENQICYWLIIGISLGACIMGLALARYAYDITAENKALRRENGRIKAYVEWKSRNALSLGDK